MTHASLSYRADIDGLRAFAVLSVVIFHAFPSFLQGGFIGVDVFFVISGFLISSLMIKDLEDGKFSFLDFYARRVKRIFPALVVVLSACFTFAWFVLFDDELKQLGNHLLRAAVFLSNFILWHEAGYFDNVAETKPLLHLWSLGIEEQFYIVWPLVMWALWRFRQKRALLVFSMLSLSFCWNIWQSQRDLTHDFYSPLTRFWELMGGAWLAVCLPHLSVGANWQRYSNHRSWAGIFLLFMSVLLIDKTKAFPGAWAFLPVAGAMLVISGGGSSWVNQRLFSNSALVWFGLISYPLYLWHWPIFSFARIIESGAPSASVRMLLVFFSVVMAWLTYKLIEKPIRWHWQSTRKTPILVVCMVGLGVLGFVTNKNKGFPDREAVVSQHIKHEGDIGHEAFHAYFRGNFFPCAEESIQNTAGNWLGMVRCFQSKPLKRVDLVLLGDSHAEHLFIGVAEALPHLNVAYYAKGALPLLQQPEFDAIFKHLLSEKNVKAVVITAMWADRLSEVSSADVLASDLSNTIRALQQSGKAILLTNDIPKFDFDPQRCKFQRPLSQSTSCQMPISDFEDKRSKYMLILQKVVNENPSVNFLSLSEQLCGSEFCSMAHEGKIYYRDSNHLNIVGSKDIGAKVAYKINRLLL